MLMICESVTTTRGRTVLIRERKS
uniref:Uncharacterized protein n=1 Tax=Arundo donax TaxID=35708 RepID=A0A0A8Y3C2_ARUDO